MAKPFPEIVTLVIAGQQLEGWTSVSVRKALDDMAGSFELTLANREKTGGPIRRIEPGAACTVEIDGVTLITGYVDQVEPSVSKDEASISVSGRDKAGDLVDCAATGKPNQWRNAPLKTIVSDLVRPFGVPVDLRGEQGAPIARFAIEQGETVQQTIERLLRLRALTAWSSRDGTLIIGNPAASAAALGRIVEGVHPAELSVVHDAAERFSDYIVKGQASGDDHASGAAVAQLKGEAKDPAITRYRPTIIVAEDQGDAAAMQRRATWEANVRAARSQTVQLGMPGWYAPNGELWDIDQRWIAEAETLAIESELIITAVEFSRDEASTRTTLTLQRPEAWQQLPVPEQAKAGSIRRKARSK